MTYDLQDAPEILVEDSWTPLQLPPARGSGAEIYLEASVEGRGAIIPLPTLELDSPPI